MSGQEQKNPPKKQGNRVSKPGDKYVCKTCYVARENYVIPLINQHVVLVFLHIHLHERYIPKAPD